MEEEGIKLKFGSRVRYYRLLKKISQEELAFNTGLHRTYISELERGYRNITLINIHKISRSLDVKLVDLLNIDN